MKEKEMAQYLYKDYSLDSGRDCFICGQSIPFWKLQYIGQGKYKHKNCKNDISCLLNKKTLYKAI